MNPEMKISNAIVQSGWVLPDPPEHVCTRPDVIALAVDTGDGWALEWGCSECGWGNGDSIPWPFIDDWATIHDLEALGFEIA